LLPVLLLEKTGEKEKEKRERERKREKCVY
jgi:hypothetical protein